MMSSNPYKPDSWEKPFYDSSVKSVFPSDLIKHPDKYSGKLIHLVGIVDSVYLDNANMIWIRFDQHYWDYIEDYSIQDEKMFISEKGEGNCWVTVPADLAGDTAAIKKFPAEHKLLLLYGNFKELFNGLPLFTAVQVKYFDYTVYSTKIFSYEIQRDAHGNVETDKKGNPRTTNLHFLKVAGPGQNK